MDPIELNLIPEVQALRTRMKQLETLIPFVVHGGLYCYKECECGLDAITYAAYLPRCTSFPT